jgi:hypothetical protein
VSSLLLKKRNELEWPLNGNKCFNPPNIAPAGIFRPGMIRVFCILYTTITCEFLMKKRFRLDQEER